MGDLPACQVGLLRAPLLSGDAPAILRHADLLVADRDVLVRELSRQLPLLSPALEARVERRDRRDAFGDGCTGADSGESCRG